MIELLDLPLKLYTIRDLSFAIQQCKEYLAKNPNDKEVQKKLNELQEEYNDR